MHTLELDEIVIVDDEDIGVELSQLAVDEFNVPIRVISKGKKFTNVNQLLTEIIKGPEHIGVLCDHKLMPGALASFYGSELVAGLYKQNIPAILVTQCEDQDIENSIREYRRWMPSLILREKLTEENIEKAFTFCKDELNGVIPSSRKPHRTLVEITSSKKDGEVGIAEAIVRGWSPEERVGFPLHLMPDHVAHEVLKDLKRNERAFVFADVNIGTLLSSELYFDSFELIEKLPGLSLESLFTHL